MKCGVITSGTGKPCRRPAGAGTPTPGRGPCSRHGGQLPNVQKHHARAQAHDFVVGQLGYEMQVDPLEAAVMAVWMARGAVEFWRAELGKWHGEHEGQTPPIRLTEGYRMAMQDLGRMADTAAKAGVAERLIAITERMAEQITLCFEEALEPLKGLSADERMQAVLRFGERLAGLEAGSTLALPAGSG